MLKYLVLKKENEDGPEIKGGHMDALIIHATKVEKISEGTQLSSSLFISPVKGCCFNGFLLETGKQRI